MITSRHLKQYMEAFAAVFPPPTFITWMHHHDRQGVWGWPSDQQLWRATVDLLHHKDVQGTCLLLLLRIYPVWQPCHYQIILRCICSYKYFVQHVIQAHIGSLPTMDFPPLQHPSHIMKGFAWTQLTSKRPSSLDVIWQPCFSIEVTYILTNL